MSGVNQSSAVAYSRLLSNSGVTIFSYGLITLLNLASVPLIISHFGLAGLGVFAVARTCTPQGFAAIFDWGYGEMATRIVASANATSPGEKLSRIYIISFFAMITGIALGVLLLTFSAQVAGIMGGADALGENIRAVNLIGWVTPVLFLGLVADGIFKGKQFFVSLRSLEVLATCAWFSALLVPSFAFGISEFIQIWIVVQSLRIICAFAVLFSLFGIPSVSLKDLTQSWPQVLPELLIEMSTYRTLKIAAAIQTQSPIILIGVLLSPAAVGIYDGVMRIPRLVKVMLGLVAQSVLPTAVKLREAGPVQYAALANMGLLVITALVVPPLTLLILSSDYILELWLGDVLEPYKLEVAVALSVPFLNIFLTPSSIFGAQIENLRKNTRFIVMQVIIQLLLTFVLYVPYGVSGIIWAGCIAAALVFPFHLRFIAVVCELSSRTLWDTFRIVCLSIISYGMLILFKENSSVPVFMATCCIFSIALPVMNFRYMMTYKSRQIVSGRYGLKN